MVYVGYPVNLEEALRLFNLEFNEEPTSSYYYYSKCREFINKKINQYGLGFYVLDKNLHVIGLNLDESLGSCWENHISIDDSIMILLESKKKIKEAMKNANIDLSNIEITHMEGEDIIMDNPEPFLINYSYN